MSNDKRKKSVWAELRQENENLKLTNQQLRHDLNKAKGLLLLVKASLESIQYQDELDSNPFAKEW